jgi:hypothetical protein
MRAHDAKRQSWQMGLGDIGEWSSRAVTAIRLRGIVEKLRAVGLSIELKHVRRYVMPIVVKRDGAAQ